MGFISTVYGAAKKIGAPIEKEIKKALFSQPKKSKTPKTPKPKAPKNPSVSPDSVRGKILGAGFAPKGWKPGDPDPAPEAPKTPKTIVAPKKPKEIVPGPEGAAKPKTPKAPKPKTPKEATPPVKSKEEIERENMAVFLDDAEAKGRITPEEAAEARKLWGIIK